MRTLLILLVLVLNAAAQAEDGAELYAAQCAACHGPEALGMQATFSPRLAGQNAAYLREQLLAYKQGTRGAHVDDTQGQTMRVISFGLNATQLDALSRYLADLDATMSSRNAVADNSGAALYRDHCAVCHGQNGDGAESIFVPNLAILSSWYLDAQLHAYENGWRGGDTGSTRAKNMRSISGQLPGSKERSEVVRHIAGSQ